MTDDIVMWYRLGLHIKSFSQLCLLLLLEKNLQSARQLVRQKVEMCRSQFNPDSLSERENKNMERGLTTQAFLSRTEVEAFVELGHGCLVFCICAIFSILQCNLIY